MGYLLQTLHINYEIPFFHNKLKRQKYFPTHFHELFQNARKCYVRTI
jgi:hypothetical protein